MAEEQIWCICWFTLQIILRVLCACSEIQYKRYSLHIQDRSVFATRYSRTVLKNLSTVQRWKLPTSLPSLVRLHTRVDGRTASIMASTREPSEGSQNVLMCPGRPTAQSPIKGY